MTTILHLTDLHFGVELPNAVTALAQRKNTLGALRDTLAGLRGADRPDVVVVSGDIGWAGRPDDYRVAVEWLRSLLDVLKLGPERLVLCAGNHDLDRVEAEGMERPDAATRADQLLRVERLVPLSRPFTAFEAFAREMGVPPLLVGECESRLVGVRSVCGIRFVVANTAWFCRDNHDRGKLFVGLPQLEVMEAARQLDESDLTIAVLHHPDTWLADDETTPYEGRAATYHYLADRCHILLSGHTHGGVVPPKRIGDGGLLFVGGAGYDGGRYRNNVSLLRIDAAAGSVERRPYEFDPRYGRWPAREASTHSLRRETAPPAANPQTDAQPRERIPVHNPPRNLPPRQEKFAGRKAELREVHERLSRGGAVGIRQQAAVHGHGGIGKTALAIQYGWEHLADYPGGVFFLSCESELPPPIAELAPHLGLERAESADETASRVKRHLETGSPCLLILDNVDGAEPWRSWEREGLLPGEACRRLVTTRADSLPGVAMYPLQRLATDDGVKLLAGYREDVEENRESVTAVVEWFDGLAVGLTVVGVYMARQRRLSWGDYVAALEQKGLGAVRQTEHAVGGLPDYEARVDSVFDELLDNALPVEQRRALEYAALLPEDQAYAPWLAELLVNDDDVEMPELPGYEREGWAKAAAGALVDAQLLRVRGEESVVGLHRVLRRRVRERLAQAGAVDRLVDRVAELAERRGAASHAALTETGLRRELTSLVALSRELDALGRTVAAVSLANWVTTPLRDLGRFRDARVLLEEFATVERLKALPDDKAATLLSNLALTLHDLGELGEARRRMERAIEIEEAHFAPDHPTLATSYCNLAVILKDLGELGEARRRMERAIQIDEAHFAPDHSRLATNYSNLALILQDLGELGEARRRMERALEINEAQFAADHPKLAIRYNNLAVILQDLGEMGEARRRMERAIEIDEGHFAADHPTLANRYNNLGSIELQCANQERACALFRRAKAILDKHFPATHPHVKLVAANIERARMRSPQ